MLTRLKSMVGTPLIIRRTLRTGHPLSNMTQYFEYARAKQLRTDSTVFNGTTFELSAMEELTKCMKGMSLSHVGGTNDNGIDLTGTWDLTNLKIKTSEMEFDELNVLVQCKNYSTKIPAKEIRELAGIFHAEFNEMDARNSIMLFCAPNVLTKNGIQQVLVSNIPIGFCQISRLVQVKKGDVYDVENYRGGNLMSFLVNSEFEKLLQGTNVMSDIERLLERNRGKL